MHKRILFRTKFVRCALALLAALIPLTLVSGTALAAAPSNDTIGNATPVTIGFSEVLDTTEATTDPDDAQLTPVWCGVPATDASVWYVFTAASDIRVGVDVRESDYSAGVLVGVGSPGSLETIACGSGAVMFSAEAGKTYYALAIDDQGDGGGNGGLLSISFAEAPPPTVDITVNPIGQFNARTVVATISGTYTCTNADWIGIEIGVEQNAGRFRIGTTTFFGSEGTCDGIPHTWVADTYPSFWVTLDPAIADHRIPYTWGADVFPQNRKLSAGKVMLYIWGYACGFGGWNCGYGGLEQEIQLRLRGSRN
jgi:hypothetical protein